MLHLCMPLRYRIVRQPQAPCRRHGPLTANCPARHGLFGLFANAELAEDFAQEVVGGEFAGDGVEGVLGEAEFLGEEVQGGGGSGEVARASST